jgi:hypothetical protein
MLALEKEYRKLKVCVYACLCVSMNVYACLCVSVRACACLCVFVRVCERER